jgi:hypothetical protein
MRNATSWRKIDIACKIIVTFLQRDERSSAIGPTR